MSSVGGQALSSGDPGNFTYRLRLSIAHTHRGLVLGAQGRVVESATALERAQMYLDELAARDPANRAWRREWATGHFNLGHARMAAGNPSAAAALFERAVSITQALVDDDSKNTGWQRYLAEYRGAYADALAAAGDGRAAAREADAAIALAADLIARPGGDLQAARIASAAHGVLARVAERRRDTAGARAHWERAVDAIPEPARAGRDYRVLDPLAVALVRLGRGNDAAPILRTLDAMGYRHPLFVRRTQAPGPSRPARTLPREGQRR